MYQTRVKLTTDIQGIPYRIGDEKVLLFAILLQSSYSTTLDKNSRGLRKRSYTLLLVKHTKVNSKVFIIDTTWGSRREHSPKFAFILGWAVSRGRG